MSYPPNTPTTPEAARPAQSHTPQSTPAFTPDSSPDFSIPSCSPQTPTTPTRTHQRNDNRRSVGNIRRKPVPLTADDFELELANIQISHDDSSGNPGSPSVFHLPTYPYQQSLASSTRSHVLLADPPLYQNDDPFRTPSATHHSTFTLPELDQAVMDRSSTGEDLPTYEVETKMEPSTLARGLWRCGWAMPLLWIIGMCILWIPLKPLEEETDPEKAQKMSEMIAILRKTELKYARRCLWGVVGWGVLIAVIILISVLVKHLK